MSIIRSKKKRNPYVQIDKTPLLDIRLSWKARGLLAYLMTKPDDWEISIANLVGQSELDGRESVQSGLKELENIGYIVRERAQDPQGRFIGWHTLIFETPVDASDYINNRQPGNPLSAVPSDGLTENGQPVCRQNRKRETRKRSNRQSVSPTTENPLQLINKEELINELIINSPSYSPKGETLLKSEENLTSQPEEPETGIQSTSLATVFNQPDSQLQPINPSGNLFKVVQPSTKIFHCALIIPLHGWTTLNHFFVTPHEEQSAAASLVGNEAMKLEEVGKNEVESLIGDTTMGLETGGKNQLELLMQVAFRQNFELELGISQTDKDPAPAAIKSSTGDEYSGHSGIETKIAAPQASPPAVLSDQPEQQHVEPNSFGQDEHDAVLPTRKIAAIETSPPVPNSSQHQAPARLQTDSRFHPRSVASREQETRFDRNQADLTKNLDGSDRLPWDTNKRGVFDQAFENHMARSLMQYPAYRDLMAGELITKVRKHISAGRYDLKRRDELLIEWEAMQNPAHNDFSTPSSTLTAKGAARRAKIARALNMKDYL